MCSFFMVVGVRNYLRRGERTSYVGKSFKTLQKIGFLRFFRLETPYSLLFFLRIKANPSKDAKAKAKAITNSNMNVERLFSPP